MKKIVLTGGGTAGHVIPALALLPMLKNTFDEIHFIGGADSVEQRLCEEAGVIFHAVPCIKFRRKPCLENLVIPFRLPQGIIAAEKVIDAISPCVVFSKGGFAALPASIGHGKAPLVLHESDLNMGLANRISAPGADRILTAFESENGECVGSPIRQELYDGDAERARKFLNLRNDDKPILLVVGGSQGAQAVNNVIFDALPTLLRQYAVIHIVGQKNVDGRKTRRYRQIGFTKDIADLFALADCVVSRGGANTLFELISLKKPTVVIPLPKSGASRGDQEGNAEYFRSRGCVRVISQNKLSVNTLIDEIESTVNSRDKLIRACSKINADGTEKIARILSRYAEN